jgi:TetR/AcrR family transcriptional regulator
MESTEIILNKAEKLFADSGFGSVSMTNIAKACNMSKANLYHHFSSKEDLYRQILIRAQKNTQNILEKTKEITGTYIEKIEFFINEHLNQMLKDPMKYKLLAREFSDLGLSSRSLPSIGLMEQNLSQIVDLIDQAKRKQEIVETTDSRLLAYQLLSPNLTYITHQNLFDSVFEGLGPSLNKNFSKTLTTNLLRGVKRND